MPSRLDADFSKFPPQIRDLFPLLAGETIELRQHWELYHRFFISSEPRFKLMSEHLGPLLGVIQNLLQDEIFLGISRLADRSNRQPNLSLKILKQNLSGVVSSAFENSIADALNEIQTNAEYVLTHRHKRIAHFDLQMSLNASLLPSITLDQILKTIEKIEAFLNLFYKEFEDSTMFFDTIPITDLTGRVEATALKAKAYELLEQSGTIERNYWRKLLKDHI